VLSRNGVLCADEVGYERHGDGLFGRSIEDSFEKGIGLSNNLHGGVILC
jgi:hypothetical protein